MGSCENGVPRDVKTECRYTLRRRLEVHGEMRVGVKMECL